MDATGPLEIGHILDGKYFIEALQGRGGMGVVYRARHVDLGAQRAIKVVLPERLGEAEVLKRFRNEALLAAGLNHPNIVRLYDFSQLHDGTWYIVWEFVEGQTVASLIKSGKIFTLEEVADLIGQAADGLEAAHAQGILHRDISPDNLMICSGANGDRVMKVLDFGIAKALGENRPAGLHSTPVPEQLGKVAYSAPELCQGRDEVGPWTDVFSLGVVTYAMITGSLPFKASSFGAYLDDLFDPNELRVEERIAQSLPAPWREPLCRALRREPATRTPSMGELKRDLERVRAETERIQEEVTLAILPRPATKKPRARPGIWLHVLMALRRAFRHAPDE